MEFIKEIEIALNDIWGNSPTLPSYMDMPYSEAESLGLKLDGLPVGCIVRLERNGRISELIIQDSDAAHTL